MRILFPRGGHGSREGGPGPRSRSPDRTPSGVPSGGRPQVLPPEGEGAALRRPRVVDGAQRAVQERTGRSLHAEDRVAVVASRPLLPELHGRHPEVERPGAPGLPRRGKRNRDRRAGCSSVRSPVGIRTAVRPRTRATAPSGRSRLRRRFPCREYKSVPDASASSGGRRGEGDDEGGATAACRVHRDGSAVASTARRAIARPRPVPELLVEKYGSNSRARASGSTPTPVSSTSRTTDPLSARTRRVRRPPRASPAARLDEVDDRPGHDASVQRDRGAGAYSSRTSTPRGGAAR